MWWNIDVCAVLTRKWIRTPVKIVDALVEVALIVGVIMLHFEFNYNDYHLRMALSTLLHVSSNSLSKVSSAASLYFFSV